MVRFVVAVFALASIGAAALAQTTPPPYGLSGFNGTDGAPTPPAMQFTTSKDKYPLLQVLPYTHNNTSLNFDAYYDGSWHTSIPLSSAGTEAAFSLYKADQKFYLRYINGSGSGGISAGGTFGAWQNALTVDAKGCVTIGTSTFGNCSSDARLKTAVTPLAPSLAAVARLQLVEFDFRREQFPQLSLPAGRHSGVIAQQVQQVMPDLVSTDAAGLLQVDYSRLDRRLQAAVVDMARASLQQQQQLADLRQELAALRAQLAQRPAAAH